MKSAIIIISLIAVVVGLLYFSRSPEKPISQLTNRELALLCDDEMAGGFHVHPILEIVANGENVSVPTNIGVQQTCMTALHTHTPDGVIHVESPEKRDYTLADFFAVWKQPFSKDEILGFKADANHRVRITVDGVEVDSFESTVLKDKERIVISYEQI
ncbi:MAG: hypothetical protein ABA06_01315 [Parcubacteria bacterium C7867-001]|nr:MAG: hypothetical protein ABA06_01315 [Parcubacteria bacterium C7867-001]